jgi:hypothetical protein
MTRAKYLLPLCRVCGLRHYLWWSPWCVLCWGDVLGRVPGDRDDDGELLEEVERGR